MPICVSEPMGSPNPRLASSTPAMSVVVTAPRPTHRMPSLPSAGAMVGGALVMAESLVLRSNSSRGVVERESRPAECRLQVLDAIGVRLRSANPATTRSGSEDAPVNVLNEVGLVALERHRPSVDFADGVRRAAVREGEQKLSGDCRFVHGAGTRRVVSERFGGSSAVLRRHAIRGTATASRGQWYAPPISGICLAIRGNRGQSSRGARGLVGCRRSKFRARSPVWCR